jgi:polyketide cyclase/dehydrase/lipid transport protein
MSLDKGLSPAERWPYATARIAGAAIAVCMMTALNAVALPSPPVSLTRSVEVNASAAEVWAKIGGFCAIKDWHPAIGSCKEDGKSPPTRTLVTKDGSATFVELQTGRSAKKRFYSYTFTSAPIPVTHYSSTIKVTAKGKDASTVTWSGEYVPDGGMEKAATDALTGIYESGLAEIKAQLEK